MNAFFTILLTALRGAILISGLVVVMMMVFEVLNVSTRGRLFPVLAKSGTGQVILSGLLGAVPGCVGGFAAVSMYTHRLVGFGALLAMLVATAGDEAFLMLALFPSKALPLFLFLLLLGIVAGLVCNRVMGQRGNSLPTRLEDTFEVHQSDMPDLHRKGGWKPYRLDWRRLVLVLGILLFFWAYASGFLEGEHVPEGAVGSVLPLLVSERWVVWPVFFLILPVLWWIRRGDDHFVREHLWEHIVCRHLPAVFLWSFGVLLVVETALHFADVSAWIGAHPLLMLPLAIGIGLIPQSGPHMAFVTLYAAGIIPFPVLLANTIVQDGHAALPLLSESRSSFFLAKGIKVLLALVIVGVWYLFF